MLATILLSVLLAQNAPLQALGGTLIDGHGGPQLRNSVIICLRRANRSGGTGGDAGGAGSAEVIATEGMSVLPGLRGVGHK